MAFEIMENMNGKYGSEILYFLLAIFLIIIQKYFFTIWQKKDRKKRRSLWIQVLRNNEIINESLLKFEKIKYMSGIYLFFSMIIGSLLGFTLTVILFFYFIELTSNMGTAGALISFINFLPYFVLILTMRYIKKSYGNLDKSYLIKYYFTGINWFLFTTNLIIFFFFFVIILRLNQFNQIELNTFFIIYLYSFLPLASVVYGFRKLQQGFYENIKISINNLYLNKFPYLEIVTKDENLNGNLEDIFNEDIIILDKNGLKIVIEWDSISSLKFHEKISQSNLYIY